MSERPAPLPGDHTQSQRPNDRERISRAFDGTTSYDAGGSSDPMLPARIGQFEIRDVLGVGSFGRVFVALDPKTERKVAIKQPFGEGLRPEYRDDFLKEARAAAAIDQHPNVCPVYHVDTDAGLPYIVMRFVAGGTLKNFLARQAEPLPVPTAVAFARKIALGLAAAHARGIIHRDLKPANVLMDDVNDELLLTDFGLARITTQALATVSLQRGAHGTPSYMPPEQWGSTAFGAITPGADLYSLGVILYQMLAGRLPFTGTQFELMTRHCTEQPEPPSVFRPEVPTALEAICLRAMAKKPQDRFASATHFADAMEELLARWEPKQRVKPDPPREPGRPPAPPVVAVVEPPEPEPPPPQRRADAVSASSVPLVPAPASLPVLDSPHRAREEQLATAARLGAEIAWTNSLGIHFRLIPAGAYRAGPTPDDPTAKPGTRPVLVKIDRPFWAASFVLTNRTVAAFLDDPGGEKLATDRLFAPAAREGGADDLPATHVSAQDAAVLCRWLGRADSGGRYRLPTEAEWEFLARAGVELAMQPRVPLAPSGGPSPADSRRANAFGILDAVGNVAQWTATPFAARPDAAALNGSGPDGAGGVLAIRGGSWRCAPNELSLAWRRSVSATRRADDLGVRLVCEVVTENRVGG